MWKDGNIASVKIDGVYHPLKAGITVIGKLKFSLEQENKEAGLYSWIVYLENDSDEKSPRIQELCGLDITFPVQGAAKFNTLRGDDCSPRSFFAESFDLTEGQTVSRSPVGARSSNITAFPYFDIEDEAGEGIVCGIGWSGQWKLNAARQGNDVHVSAGFQDCDFVLEPHEKVRSVRVLIYTGKGGEEKLRHSFVRLHRKYYSPVPEIKNDTYFPVAASCFDRYYWGNIPAEGEVNYFETEEAQINIINSAADCGLNSFWLDACWFDGAFRTGVGNYRYAEGFSDTLRGLGNLSHRRGMRFILWFEPVRALKDTDIYTRFGEDKEKIIPLPEVRDMLVNLGDPEVWQYQFEHISETIEKNGVDVYREDFNIDPIAYLKTLETPDRVGIAQIRFVEGLYRLWDAILERFPGIRIDNCASGGRLLDVETAMRAIPLWRSDMGCRPSPLGMQNEVLCLSRYLPYHQGGAYDHSAYFVRSSFTTGVTCVFAFLAGIIDPEKEEISMRAVAGENDPYLVSEVSHIGELDAEDVRRSLNEAMELRRYWNGDFTALTPPSDSRSAMIAYTLRLEEEDSGIVLIFRREEASGVFTVKLSDVCAEKQYRLCFSDEDLVRTEKTVLGKELLDGMDVRIDQCPGSLLIFYDALE